MVLGQVEDKIPVITKFELPAIAIEKEVIEMENSLQPVVAENYLAPQLVEEALPVIQAPVIDITDMKEQEEPAIIHFVLQAEQHESVGEEEKYLV